MAIEPWLPIGFALPDGAKTRSVLYGGADWQIMQTVGGGRALVAQPAILENWVRAGLVSDGSFHSFSFGDTLLWELSCGPSQILTPVFDGPAPQSKQDAMAFAIAFRETREIDPSQPLQDAIYVEKISRLLPAFGIAPSEPAATVAGYWLTGGISISATAFRRMQQAMGWLPGSDLREIIEAAGLEIVEARPAPSNSDHASSIENDEDKKRTNPSASAALFALPGRPALEAFFNEHVVEIIQNKERYSAMGIGFPSAIALHGPPGCGKTFAVERLVDFLGWPSFQIDASSVASPYIHETSKKVAEVFDKAMQHAPSVLVIDEMEAFLADREMGSGHHRVEEVAEFLRRIPEAVQNEVLIIGMTNRIDMIDPAIMRRGRFDHMIEVSFASEHEILALIDTLLAKLPTQEGLDSLALAKALTGRPLSDVTFVIREGARLAARSGNDRIEQSHLIEALKATPNRSGEREEQRRIGFI